MSRLWIDHVIYAVEDVDTAAAAIAEREGLGSVRGGRHEGWGTANRIVPLGESYLELVAVVDPEEAESSDFGRAILRGLADDRPLVGWVVATDDVDAVAKRLELEVEERSRETADGSTISWRLAGLERALESGALPFFIEWGVPEDERPAAADAPHEMEPEGIAWVEIAGERDELSEWLGEDADLPVRVEDGRPGLRSVAIATAMSEIVIR
jgi:Glyoxalase-like domain